MIAADTNVLIRHLTQDDAAQAAAARRLFNSAEAREEPVFLAHIVLCEMCWVLKAVYGFGKPEIILALRALLDDRAFHVQDRPVVAEALAAYQRHSGQFPDHLLGAVAHQQGAATTYTFDRGAARYPRFTMLP